MLLQTIIKSFFIYNDMAFLKVVLFPLYPSMTLQYNKLPYKEVLATLPFMPA